MTDPGAPGPVRERTWPVEGPVELDLAVEVGRVQVRLADAPSEVRVEVRHDPAAGGGWASELGDLIGWIGSAGAGGTSGGSPAADAVEAAEIDWSGDARRLVVRAPADLPLRMVPLAVTVSAPSGSRVTARTAAGDVAVEGRAGDTTVRTGAGSARVAAVEGDAEITTGSGAVELGTVSRRARVRTGSGAVAVGSTGGPADIKAGSGDVRLGAVDGDLEVRTGSGAVRVADARAGRFELRTGSGSMRIGVHAGVLAELDLASGSGRAHSELTIGRSTPPREPALLLRGRTASGDVLVTRAEAATTS